MIFGADFFVWGMLFTQVLMVVSICAIFGVFYALVTFRTNKVRSIFIFISSILFIIPICIFLGYLFLPKKKMNINLYFDPVVLNKSNDINGLCKTPYGLEGQYFCSSDYSYNLKIHFSNGAEFRAKCNNLGFSVDADNFRIKWISFFNESTYSLNELKEFLRGDSQGREDFSNQSPVPHKISVAMLEWLESRSDSAHAVCDNTMGYRMCIRVSSSGGDYHLGYEFSETE